MTRTIRRVSVPQTVPVHRLSFEDVLAMVDAGILDETAHVELEGGVLVEMEPTGGAHANRVQWLTMHFARAAGDAYVVRVQDTFLIPDGGFYEPDLIVMAPTGDELPRTAHLIVEVAFSSRSRDVEKAVTYAAAGVGEYWIVDVQRGEVVVHSHPQADGYAATRRYVGGDTVAPPVPAPPVDVATLLAG